MSINVGLDARENEINFSKSAFPPSSSVRGNIPYKGIPSLRYHKGFRPLNGTFRLMARQVLADSDAPFAFWPSYGIQPRS